MLVLTTIQQNIERIDKMTKLWHLPWPGMLGAENVQQRLRQPCRRFLEHLEVNVDTYSQLLQLIYKDPT